MAREGALTREHYERVAEIWLAALAQEENPTQAVGRAFAGRTGRTISRWVRQAREQGLLPVSKPGSTNLRQPRVVATAEALGVSYEDLVIALRDHANGYLRVGALEEQHARAALRTTVLRLEVE